MALKFCRFCNTPLGVGENVPSVGDFCSDDHRRQFQEKIQRETIERLKRSESRSPHSGPELPRSILQPGPPPNLIPTPPMQSVPRAGATSAAVALAIVPNTELEPVESSLAEISKVTAPVPVAPPQPPPAPLPKTDNAELSNLLRQAKGRIASDPNAPTMALALRRRPRPAAKPPAPPPKPSPQPQARPSAIPVRPAEIVAEPDPALDPVFEPVSSHAAAGAFKPEPRASFEAAPPSPAIAATGIVVDAQTPALEFTPADESLLARMPWAARIAIAAALAAAGGGLYWQSEKAKSSRAVRTAEVRIAPLAIAPGDWVNQPAAGADAQRSGRTLTVFKPSLGLTDYRVEFTGEISHRALGWVFRMRDASNYHAAKLLYIPNAKVRLNLVRWTVKNGVPGEKTWIPIDGPLPANGRYVVRVDVRGDSFATRVQGRQADRFTDSTFPSGGFGFANENTERGKIESASVGVYATPAAN
jgi:hypothetical protein